MDLKPRVSAVPTFLETPLRGLYRRLGFAREFHRCIRLFRSLYRRIERLSGPHALLFVVTSFVVGQAINTVAPMERFFLYQLLFIPAVVIAFREIKIFMRSVDKYRATVASHPINHTAVFVSRLLQSYWTVPGLVIVSSLYVYSTITLKYVSLNATGFYALTMIGFVMLSAILGQTCYVYYLLLLRRVARCEHFKYNFYFPARTNWVQLLAEMGTRLSSAFFILGFIYTAVFFLNMPSGYVSISRDPWKLELSTPNNAAFVASWLTIFVIIILAFPLYAWLNARFLKAIIRRLKDISINEIETLMDQSNIRGKGDADTELKYYQLMLNIESSSDRPSETTNTLPVLLTLSSIAVHLIKISESFSP